MMRWYAVHTRPAAEARAAENLDRQGYVTYLPRHRRWVRHARRRALALRPLFPRYLFVGMNLAVARWRAIRSTVGIAGLVCQGDQPGPVPRGIVEMIQARENEEGMVTLLAAPVFDKGERVHITEGALRGVNGLFESITDEERVIILLDLLGRQVRVRVPLENVQAVA